MGVFLRWVQTYRTPSPCLPAQMCYKTPINSPDIPVTFVGSGRATFHTKDGAVNILCSKHRADAGPSLVSPLRLPPLRGHLFTAMENSSPKAGSLPRPSVSASCCCCGLFSLLHAHTHARARAHAGVHTHARAHSRTRSLP